ncbi:hypothetical protein HDU93_005436 [Gonapodya sp. JEL0774]|nr:hypothetical protein HDU93_005436 [Gonapodya sp. JEL0774]
MGWAGTVLLCQYLTNPPPNNPFLTSPVRIALPQNLQNQNHRNLHELYHSTNVTPAQKVDIMLRVWGVEDKLHAVDVRHPQANHPQQQLKVFYNKENMKRAYPNGIGIPVTQINFSHDGEVAYLKLQLDPSKLPQECKTESIREKDAHQHGRRIKTWQDFRQNPKLGYNIIAEDPVETTGQIVSMLRNTVLHPARFQAPGVRHAAADTEMLAAAGTSNAAPGVMYPQNAADQATRVDRDAALQEKKSHHETLEKVARKEYPDINESITNVKGLRNYRHGANTQETLQYLNNVNLSNAITRLYCLRAVERNNVETRRENRAHWNLFGPKHEKLDRDGREAAQPSLLPENDPFVFTIGIGGGEKRGPYAPASFRGSTEALAVLRQTTVIIVSEKGSSTEDPLAIGYETDRHNYLNWTGVWHLKCPHPVERRRPNAYVRVTRQQQNRPTSEILRHKTWWCKTNHYPVSRCAERFLEHEKTWRVHTCNDLTHPRFVLPRPGGQQRVYMNRDTASAIFFDLTQHAYSTSLGHRPDWNVDPRWPPAPPKADHWREADPATPPHIVQQLRQARLRNRRADLSDDDDSAGRGRPAQRTQLWGADRSRRGGTPRRGRSRQQGDDRGDARPTREQLQRAEDEGLDVWELNARAQSPHLDGGTEEPEESSQESDPSEADGK